MKICILLMVWFICVCSETHSQNSKRVLSAEERKGENTPVETRVVSLEARSSTSPLITNYGQLAAVNNDGTCLIQKSKTQTLNGIVLLTGGSMISLLGIRSIMDVPKGSYLGLKNQLQVNLFENNNNSRLAITGLVMIAGSIPYFLNALKNRKLAGLKLACQKTFVGTNKKACRKVTGITFAIPIGK